MVRVLPLLIAGTLSAWSFGAAAQSLPPSVSSYAPPVQGSLNPGWEARLGLGATNPAGGRESGLMNFSGEILTPRAFALSDRIASAFVPRFHIGTTATVNGTNYAYAGATWTFDVSQSVFVEASVGAAINDGKTGLLVPQNRLNVGCNAGGRAAGGVGVRLNDRWNLIATMEHFSTTGCSEREKPRGPANFGARLGYSF